MVGLSKAQEQCFSTAADHKILCAYTNHSSAIKVVSAKRLQAFWFERTVFPCEVLLFEVPPDAWLEVYTSNMPSALLSEHIPCNLLQINSAKQLDPVEHAAG